MFYSKYSDYMPEQIIDEKYQQDCNELLNKVTDAEKKQKMKSILYEGGYEDFSVNSELLMKNNPDIEREKRLEIASVIADNPETFDMLVQNNIDLYHGTNINALPSILKYGMNSLDESNRIGIEVSTGEEWSRVNGKRSFISFTDHLQVAKDYASLIPKNEENKQSIGVIIGISSNEIDDTQIIKVDSDLPEVGILDNIPVENIKFIAVQKDRVEFVKKLVDDKNIDVAAIEFGMEIEKENNKYEKQSNDKKFDKQEIYDLAKGRTKSGILNLYNRIKEFVNRDKDKNKEGKKYGEDSRE